MSHYTIPAAGKACQILDAAERMFGEQGFGGVSMSNLASEAGVSKANIFHHFKSKEELYMTVLHRSRKRFVNQLLEITGKHADQRSQIQSLTRGYLRLMLENEPLVRLLMRELLERQRTGKRLAERLFADNFSHLVEVLQEAQQKGALRREIDASMVMMIIAAVSLLYIQGGELLRHLPGMEWTGDADRISEALLEILWHGIAPSSTTPPLS